MLAMLVKDVSIIANCIYDIIEQNINVVSCPGDCSGHGTCVTMNMAYSSFQASHLTEAYTPWEGDRTTMCSCDFGYTGNACEMSKSFSS